MANVIAKIKVMPEDTEVDLNKLSHAISELGGRQIVRKPVAFGLNVLECSFIVPDGAGGTQPIEDALAALDGVGEVQVTDLGREIDTKGL